jgi:predicted HD superfamily hydrolase involved in NAD metabolism
MPAVAAPIHTDAAYWAAKVRPLVKPERFEHIVRVAELARDIATANGLNAEKAYLAGILHDVARDLSGEELLQLAPPESDMDIAHPMIVHGRAARVILVRWGFTDLEVLDAVEEHTTGPRAGRPISVCVYVADVSEPGRGVNDHIRELAFEDLERAYRESLFCKVHYLQSKNKPVHPRTMAAYERLVALEDAPRKPSCQEFSTGFDTLT